MGFLMTNQISRLPPILRLTPKTFFQKAIGTITPQNSPLDRSLFSTCPIFFSSWRNTSGSSTFVHNPAQKNTVSISNTRH